MCRRVAEGWAPLLSLVFFISFTSTSIGTDIIRPGDSIGDRDTILSADGTFRLGFFSPGGGRRYLGMWYDKIPERTVVWVANRGAPLASSAGVFQIGRDGNLVLYGADGGVVWSPSSGATGARSPVAQLLDNGNLVVREEGNEDPANFIWQSFDHPTDTLLPGMKFGWNLKTGLNRYLQSWKAPDDPSPGDISYTMELQGSPQLVLRNGTSKLYRCGPWNGVRLSGVPDMKPNNDVLTFEFFSDDAEVYYRFGLRNKTVVSTLRVTPSGEARRSVRLGERWIYWAPKDCDVYATCGAYGVCNPNKSPTCSCLDGYKPRSPAPGWSGCERDTPLDCREDDGFNIWAGMKLPDASQSVTDMGLSMEECRTACLRNCSCVAYANANLTSGRGCIMWVGDPLIDLRVYPDGGQDLYVRVPASLSADRTQSSDKKRKLLLLTIIPGILAVIIISCCAISSLRRRTSKHEGEEQQTKEEFLMLEIGDDGSQKYGEFSLLGFDKVVAATDNFSFKNKLGEGGFGPVYKGMLLDGQEIAVKRLSRGSGQGMEEFKTEILLIAKLQHRNLVKLLGCCVKGEEKMLIYEYMPNKSLDVFLFDHTRAAQLNWTRRFHIIDGIAQGLLYLHKHSRLRVIHRDLKASNILLDNELNPKISDFGMARIFSSNDSTANTNRVVGTYGYMSPEYAMAGLFSIKSDVFSFGVLLLEIVTGKKNSATYHLSGSLNLLGRAWRLWKEGRELELVDPSLGDSYAKAEVARCIQVALMCVQDDHADRPTTSDIIAMLGAENASLPAPKQPVFFFEKKMSGEVSHAEPPASSSTNVLTMSIVDGR